MNGPVAADGSPADARSARGLRRAPPQRQPYTATSPATRQTRSTANTPGTPASLNNSIPSLSYSPSSAPTTIAVNNSNNNNNNTAVNVTATMMPTPTPPAATIDNRAPMFTIVVDTPSNRRGKYSQVDQPPLTRNMDPMMMSMIPEKTPRIYNHCVRGLQSHIPSEVDFALHHLVVISDERGDKFKFDDFPFLAEELVEKILEITYLVSGIRWEIDYTTLEEPRDNLLYGTGNNDIIEKMAKFRVTLSDDNVETEEFARNLRNIKEAALTLRNMSMLEANAVFLSTLEIFKDGMLVVLNTPRQPRFNEILNYALDTIEQVCPYWETDPEDPLFSVLFGLLGSSDRYHILTSLKILILFSMELETIKRLQGIPDDKINMLMSYTLLEQDKELLSGTLDFFYQYTAIPENVEELLRNFSLPTTLIPRLTNLLLFEGERDVNEIVDQEECKAPAATSIPIVPPDLHSMLLQLPEPERCSRWLKCCFIEDPECDITQLALWHAYQNCFADERVPGVSTLPAAEFINTVSRTFSSAQAQVVTGPVAKFIIRGIRPLETSYDLNGYPYRQCKWNVPNGQCRVSFVDPAKLKEHVFREHMLLNPADLGNLQDARRPTNICAWDTCKDYEIPTINTARVAGHVSTHLPPLQDMSSPPPPPPRKIIQPKLTRLFDYYPTPIDEKGEPVGIAYKAILILRNVIRNLPKESAGPEHGNRSWNYVIFFASRNKLIEIADYNPTLRRDIFELVDEIKSN
ncbi:chromatin remodeling complex subunit [Histoplasma capsulatum var. duboisii H88]|nr:chromatin remodeling complex subunit [Histoplasma capsulatum var. duboisii H88]